jgi:hypothetical protein
MAHGSWLMAHGSWLMAHGSWLMAELQPSSLFKKGNWSADSNAPCPQQFRSDRPFFINSFSEIGSAPFMILVQRTGKLLLKPGFDAEVRDKYTTKSNPCNP